MNLNIRCFQPEDLPEMTAIWNEIVDEGIAFPQKDRLDNATGMDFFSGQSYCAVAEDTDSKKILGLYILHPNNIGRCGHICNASYAVASHYRGRHAGKALVTDCMTQAKALGFRILQFNAVVATNTGARHLYETLGFIQLGTIPGGFCIDDHTYVDICPYYIVL